MRRAVDACGVSYVASLVTRVHEIEAKGGQMTCDGDRRRTPGGVFWRLLKEEVDADVYAEVFREEREVQRIRARKRNARRNKFKGEDASIEGSPATDADADDNKENATEHELNVMKGARGDAKVEEMECKRRIAKLSISDADAVAVSEGGTSDRVSEHASEDMELVTPPQQVTTQVDCPHTHTKEKCDNSNDAVDLHLETTPESAIIVGRSADEQCRGVEADGPMRRWKRTSSPDASMVSLKKNLSKSFVEVLSGAA